MITPHSPVDSAPSGAPDAGAAFRVAVVPALLGTCPTDWPAGWADQLVQMQKLAALGTMAAMVAHEFNNLLTRAINHAEHALNYPDDRELTQTALQKVMEHCHRAAEISRSIFDFAGKGDGGGETDGQAGKEGAPASGGTGRSGARVVSLLKLVQEALNCLGRDPGKDNIALRCRVPAGLTVHGNGTLLQQVLYNLIVNARQAVLAKDRRGGRITISADRTQQGRVVVRVSDTGCGIAPENLSKIFAPFSTKTANDRADRKGIGLGLAICRAIITDHGGTINVESVPGQGATFTVELPGN